MVVVAHEEAQSSEDANSYWQEVWWPPLEFCLILIVTAVGFIVIEMSQ